MPGSHRRPTITQIAEKVDVGYDRKGAGHTVAWLATAVNKPV